jgi:hypothetical protein
MKFTTLHGFEIEAMDCTTADLCMYLEFLLESNDGSTVYNNQINIIRDELLKRENQ